jgi:hypothetical protein
MWPRPETIAEAYRLLRDAYRRGQKEFNIELEPDVFLFTLDFLAENEQTPSNLIDFGARLAELQRRKEEVRHVDEREGRDARSADRSANQGSA